MVPVMSTCPLSHPTGTSGPSPVNSFQLLFQPQVWAPGSGLCWAGVGAGGRQKETSRPWRLTGSPAAPVGPVSPGSPLLP